MSSVRLEPELELQVRELARQLGLTPSEVHRRPLKAYCNAAFAERKRSRYADVIGIASGPEDLSERAGEIFAPLLEERSRSAGERH